MASHTLIIPFYYYFCSHNFLLRYFVFSLRCCLSSQTCPLQNFAWIYTIPCCFLFIFFLLLLLSPFLVVVFCYIFVIYLWYLSVYKTIPLILLFLFVFCYIFVIIIPVYIQTILFLFLSIPSFLTPTVYQLIQIIFMYTLSSILNVHKPSHSFLLFML